MEGILKDFGFRELSWLSFLRSEGFPNHLHGNDHDFEAFMSDLEVSLEAWELQKRRKT